MSDVGRGSETVGSWQSAVRSLVIVILTPSRIRQPRTGNCKLETGNWKLLFKNQNFNEKLVKKFLASTILSRF